MPNMFDEAVQIIYHRLKQIIKWALGGFGGLTPLLVIVLATSLVGSLIRHFDAAEAQGQTDQVLLDKAWVDRARAEAENSWDRSKPEQEPYKLPIEVFGAVRGALPDLELRDIPPEKINAGLRATFEYVTLPVFTRIEWVECKAEDDSSSSGSSGGASANGTQQVRECEHKSETYEDEITVLKSVHTYEGITTFTYSANINVTFEGNRKITTQVWVLTRQDFTPDDSKLEALFRDFGVKTDEDMKLAKELFRENMSNAYEDPFAAPTPGVSSTLPNRPIYGGPLPNLDWVWPVPGHHTITDPFGWRCHPVYTNPDGSCQIKHHNGTDIAAPSGTPVVAAHDGVVTYSGYLGAFGNRVEIVHPDGYETSYSHLSNRRVYAGQPIRAGEIVGWVGSTGVSTGPHLHFEVVIGGGYVDPMRINYRNK